MNHDSSKEVLATERQLADLMRRMELRLDRNKRDYEKACKLQEQIKRMRRQ